MTTPVADDEFPEFAEPPRHRPSPEALAPPGDDPEADGAQGQVDEVIERLRRARAEGDR